MVLAFHVSKIFLLILLICFFFWFIYFSFKNNFWSFSGFVVFLLFFFFFAFPILSSFLTFYHNLFSFLKSFISLYLCLVLFIFFPSFQMSATKILQFCCLLPCFFDFLICFEFANHPHLIFHSFPNLFYFSPRPLQLSIFLCTR